MTKQKRLVARNEDLQALQRIAEITRCGSASVALSLLISRYAETFINDWKYHGEGITTAPLPPLSPPSSLTTPLDF